MDYLHRPMCGHWQSDESHGRHIAVIVTPLIVLIDDRKASLPRRGLLPFKLLGSEDHDTGMKTLTVLPGIYCAACLRRSRTVIPKGRYSEGSLFRKKHEGQ